MEDGANFTPDVFDNAYLNKELAISRNGDETFEGQGRAANWQSPQ